MKKKMYIEIFKSSTLTSLNLAFLGFINAYARILKGPQFGEGSDPPFTFWSPHLGITLLKIFSLSSPF